MSSSPSRAAQFAKVYKVLKKVYRPAAPLADRQVLEHLVFAACLENAHHEKAEEAFAALVHTFFDWNEMRVTTAKELAEVLNVLPDPSAAAHRVKRLLQHVFESTYSFDLEEMRKKNLGQSVERLKKFPGITEFMVAYAIQNALGGHAIPLDSGTLGALRLLEFIGDKDVESGAVPGLERAIAKNKGVEFGSLLHQLGADFVANPYVPAFHKILLQINPDIGANLPKRRAKPKAEPVAAAATEAATSAAEEKGKRKKGKTAEEPAAAVPPPAAPAPPPVDQAAAERKAISGKKKPVAPPKKETPPKVEPALPKNLSQNQLSQPGRPKDTEAKIGSGTGSKKSISAGLSKRKPR